MPNKPAGSMRSPDTGLISRGRPFLRLFTQAGFAAACAATRRSYKLANAILGGLLVCVLLATPTTTTAYFTSSQPQGSNVLATATKFTVSDLTVVSNPGGGGGQ